MYEKAFGSKYDKNLTTVEIAALVRKEIKAAIKSGALPKGKYSVRKDHHKSITVCISGLGFLVANPDYNRLGERDFVVHQPAERRYTPRARATLKAVEAMLEAYNYDGSDIMSDYFDVNFYSSVNLDWREVDAEKEMQTEYFNALKPTGLQLVRSA